MKRFSSSVLLAVFLAACSKTPKQREARYLEIGKKHLQSQDSQSAILDFRSAIQAMPKDAEPHYQLGVAEFSMGYSQAAVNEFRKAIELNPNHIGAQLKLAQLMSVNRNPEVAKEGEQKARSILTLEPGNPDALEALASAELRLGENPDEAREHLQEALEKLPQHLGSAMTLALEKLRSGDSAGAEQVMRGVAAAAPSSPDHAVALARFYNLIHNQAQAEQQFRRALTLDPANGPALAGLGDLLRLTGRTEEAAQVYQRASRLAAAQYHPLYGMFLLATHKNNEAVAEFARLAQSDKDDRFARSRLISAYLKIHRVSDAERTLADAIQHNPEDAEARLQRGYLSLAAGKYREAEADLTVALRFQANQPAVHLAMAKLHQARGDSDLEIQELTEALKLAPDILAARLELAGILTAKHSPNLALGVVAQAPERDSRNTSLIAAKNNALYAMGDYAGMRKGIDQGLAISRDPALLLQDGLLRMKLKDYKGSRVSLEEALKKHPEDWRCLEALALGYMAENNLAAATRAVRDYTSRAPGSLSAQDFLGTWLARTGDPAGARKAFQAEKALAPANSAADLKLAMVSFGEKKFEDARQILADVLRKEPRNAQALLQMAQIEDKTGQRMQAIAHYENAIEVNPQNAPALNNLAYLLAETGQDPDRALKLAQQVKELLPDSAIVDDTIGWAYYRKGLFHPALDHLKRASESPQRLCHLAMTYYQLGDRSEAYKTLQAAIKIDPALPEVKEATALLGQNH